MKELITNIEVNIEGINIEGINFRYRLIAKIICNVQGSVLLPKIKTQNLEKFKSTEYQNLLS